MNLKEPLVPHEILQKPWHTLGCDLFFWNNSSYLLLSDYYSKFSLVQKLNNTQSDTTIAHLKSIFEERRIPIKLVTGNDTQFTSTLFQEFRETCEFNQVPVGETAVTFGQQERRSVSSTTAPVMSCQCP